MCDIDTKFDILLNFKKYLQFTIINPQIILFILKSHIENNTAITQKANILQECSLKFCAVNSNACLLAKHVIREEQQTQ